jgi:chaperonin cofactor prefoldin
MVVAELKTKVEKYETKASRCEQQARAATDKAEQSFYEVLAG